jgi:hypothetical protein
MAVQRLGSDADSQEVTQPLTGFRRGNRTGLLLAWGLARCRELGEARG